MRTPILLTVIISICTSSHHSVHHQKKPPSQVTTLKAVPVVMWHGMGDCCCNPLSMGRIKRLIEENVEGIYVKSLMLGENIASDTERGFLANMNNLVSNACEQIRNDSLLQLGYNAIGFSQGGQFVRALAERCPDPPMRNLISLGGQQQGVYGLPYCPGDTRLCNIIRRLLDMGAYNYYVQQTVVQAQYWHDPYNEDEYRRRSIFLADINNEREINPDYKKNLLNLKNMLLILFKDDHMVVPKESAWFGFYKEGDMDTILPMNETRLYKEDLIGLRKLNELGRVHFLALEGDHLQIDEKTFIKEIIEKFLK
ncbi:unnamed protein product [Cylicocyclus nassatus]|uniref:Palmitoyl-protein thioesterase 1 n=1 Tax=Cylicocyclus nassatus TaxID=53992 RepID=A0AA36DTR4_CYLNA|nr:unnamed protein product [Cylicocyclus nassatus]